jgi:2-methylcitrate dehydratase
MKPDGQHDNAGAEPAAESRRLDRRQLFKVGAGTVLGSVVAPSLVSAQQRESNRAAAAAPHSMRTSGEISPFTGPGYKNTANRLHGNGPMDDTTRKIVSWVHSFSGSQITPATRHAFNRTMIDSMASVVAGFEEEPCRIAARVARLAQPTTMKCTVLGYGVETTPEMATFANGCLVRMVDFNDMSNEGGHVSTLIPVALAIGEALDASGAKVMESIVLGYEIAAAPAGGEAVIAAMVAGKLMDLDEDRLANALTIALTPHVALNKGVGALSMWKSTRSAESAKCGVWAAMLAREGMTGPPQPFEGRGGYWASRGAGGPGADRTGAQSSGMGAAFTLPVRTGSMAIERNWFKRRPAEASSQGLLYMMPEFRAWTKPDEIAAIHWDTSYANWEEICDAPKWDPTNRETADHSLPYMVARALIDGDVYLDSFVEAKYKDPAVRALMDKITMGGVNGWSGNGSGRLTITKKSGETKYWDTYNGVRNLETKDYPPFTEQELIAKFNRACDFKKVAPAQRDQAYKAWSDVGALSSIDEAIRTLAKFGQPRPL